MTVPILSAFRWSLKTAIYAESIQFGNMILMLESLNIQVSDPIHTFFHGSQIRILESAKLLKISTYLISILSFHHDVFIELYLEHVGWLVQNNNARKRTLELVIPVTISYSQTSS